MRLCNTLAQLRSAFILHREAQWSLQRPAKLAGLPDLTFVMVMRLHNASYKGFAEKKAWSGGKRAKVDGHFRHAEQESLCLISGQDLATAIICYLILTLQAALFARYLEARILNLRNVRIAKSDGEDHTGQWSRDLDFDAAPQLEASRSHCKQNWPCA